MNNNWLIAQTVDLQKGIQAPRMWPNALMTTQDENAHTWEITILDGGEPANITGTVTGKFLRCDNETVLIGGTLAGNVASVTLKRGCYVLPSGKNHGTLSGIMNVTTASGTMTIGALVFSVQNLTSDVIVDPGRVIPSLAELIDKIEACEEATAAAQGVIPKENLFALTRSVEGYINTDGGVSAPGAQTQERVSEYIAVTPGDAMAYQCWVNVPAGSIPWAAYCFYDSDRAKTGSVVAVTDATSTASDGSKYIAQTFTVPNGAAYIRVSFRTFGAARAKLEVGSTPTLYVVNKHDYLALQQINARTMRVDGTTLIFTEPTEE